MKGKVWTLGLVIGMIVLTTAPAFADGVIIPEGPPPMPGFVVGTPVVPPPPYLTISYHRVFVTITDQVAQTKVDQVFVNDSDRQVEGTYIFPLPEDASISGFSMYVDGQKVEGTILTKDEARRIYEQTVSQRRDPALLEYVGRGAFRARIYPIPPRGERRIQIEYSQVLDRNNDLVRYVYPLSTERFSAQPLRQVSIHVAITGREAIKAIYSPSHDVAVSRRGDYGADVGYEATNVRPDKDFVLYYALAHGDVNANLITYRQPNEDGYFLLLLTPRVQVDPASVAAKDVVLVLDTSGSMQGQKIQQAKQALRFVLDRLNPADRFALISFSTGINRFDEGLSTLQRREAAHRFVDGLSAAGSTNISGALQEALRGLDTKRPTVIIFLTDGLPTVGITDVKAIVETFGKAAPPNVRLFAFGVGYDVNTTLLDTLTTNHRGATTYVKPNENIEDALAGFYAKISNPVLTDVALDFGGIRVLDVYPTPLPDLFVGSQLLVTGRYRTSGTAALTLTGKVDEGSQRFVYSNLTFPERTGNDTAFVARLWATRRIGYLVTQIRLHGAQKELVDEIVSLGLRYGIVTPYTSFLVDERQDVLAPGGQLKAGESLGRSLATPAPSTGATAVQDSQTLRSLREAPTASLPTSESSRVYTVADKTFLLRNGVWTDTQYHEGMKTVDVGFASADYFALLAARPEWGKYFAVGKSVIVVLDGTAYRVAEGDFPPIIVPATPTPAPTPTAPSPQPEEGISIFLRLWRWILWLFGG